MVVVAADNRSWETAALLAGRYPYAPTQYQTSAATTMMIRALLTS